MLLVHAGGYSQRLASVSAVGKVFMTLPCGTQGGGGGGGGGSNVDLTYSYT